MGKTGTSGSATYLKYIAYMQVIGILLVVAGHSFHLYPGMASGQIPSFNRALYSFRMPMFMFVSGFLMIYTTKIASDPRYKPGSFFLNKLKRLILPFVTLTAVTFVPRAMMSGIANDALEMSFHSFIMAVVDTPTVIVYFWFLQVSFLLLTTSYCLLYFGRKAGIPAKLLITALFLLMLAYTMFPPPFSDTTIMSVCKIRQIGIYFMLGAMYCVFSTDIDRFIPWTRIWFTLTLAAAWIVAFNLFERTSRMWVCSLLGIMMCTSLAHVLEKREWKFLDHLMGANYMIFLLSWYFNVASQQVLSHFVTLPWWVYSLLSFVSGVYVPWLGYKYLQRHSDSRWVKVTAFILGQSIKKKNTGSDMHKPATTKVT